ncbi:MAG TPA: stage 0 sporulation protein J [Anaerolineaceae bacterium]|uniref:Chromosome partitioning protein ParB n=1 Tax=Anaerolinea thermophila TaxID=167964 RepID=A0A117LGT6_9CHLR|nr:MAG: Chromosome partitioning protein ParB [Anaerolinea thermophila]HAF62991.1 stage 0 sporulation protein J [Anaerolineaceae bacterium]
MAQRKGLGKGLDALIPGSDFSSGASSDGVNFISIELINPNPYQPRTDIRDQDLEELTASIKEHGILQPLIVTKDESADGSYTLIAGERRLRAAKLAGLESVPVLVREAMTSQQRLELALIENIQREDLSAIEAAEAYQQLSEEFDLSHEEIAIRVGKSRTAVTNTMRLLKLPPEVLNALIEGKISEGHGRALLGLENPAAQIAAMKSILSNDLNVRQTEDLVRKLTERKSPTPPPKKEVPAEVKAFEKQLRSQFGTKVSIHHGKQGGSVTFYYYSEEELENLIDQMLQS